MNDESLFNEIMSTRALHQNNSTQFCCWQIPLHSIRWSISINRYDFLRSFTSIRSNTLGLAPVGIEEIQIFRWPHCILLEFRTKRYVALLALLSKHMIIQILNLKIPYELSLWYSNTDDHIWFHNAHNNKQYTVQRKGQSIRHTNAQEWKRFSIFSLWLNLKVFRAFGNAIW